MFKKLFLVGLAIAFFVPPAGADNWPCKALLCLSNPGGPKEFKECVDPIDKLHRHLMSARPFPGCSSAEAQGYTTEDGKEELYDCAELYGEGYEMVNTDANTIDEGGQQSLECRKQIGTVEKVKCVEGEAGPESCETYQESVYKYQPIRYRTKRDFIQVVGPDGQPASDKYWYQKPSTSKSKLF